MGGFMRGGTGGTISPFLAVGWCLLTLFAAREAGNVPSPHLPQCSIIPAFGVTAAMEGGAAGPAWCPCCLAGAQLSILRFYAAHFVQGTEKTEQRSR